MTDSIITQPQWVDTRVGKKKQKKFSVDREWFYQKYSIERVPTAELALMIGCVEGHISAIADMLSIQRRGKLPNSVPSVRRANVDFVEAKRLYLEEKMSCADIGVIFGCGHGPVAERLKEAGVVLRHHNDTKRGRPSRNKRDIDPEIIRSMYLERFNSAQTVADHFGVSRQVIDRIMKEHGIQKKPKSETRDMFGDKSPRWRFDLTDEERENRRDMAAQKKWREQVYARDGYTCQKCMDADGGNLNAHHIVPHSKDKSIAWDLDNGVTLCKPCHYGFHNKYGYTKCTRENLDEFMKQANK